MKTRLATILFLAIAAATSADALDRVDPATLFSGLRYRSIGPSRGGRVTAVAGHRALRSTFFMGATGGGVWKTTNYGQTWKNVSDGFFASGSIGAIRIAESDPEVVWVGTGSDALRSNVIVGKGVYKSADGGKSWTHVGLEAVGNIGAVLIHPEHPDRVWVAAIGNPFAPNPQRGVYRTLDGGQSWENVLFISNHTGVVDLEFAPDDPDTLYAALWQAQRKPWTIISGGDEGGLYKSTDAGSSWQALAQGLPEGLLGKADLAVSAADPDRVYALIEAQGEAGGVYRSDDRGSSWRQVTDFQDIRNRPFYYTNLEAQPQNADVLWGMAEGFWKSEDSGETWTRHSTPHGDNHDMWIHPDDPNLFIQANDGGANVTRDGGETWSSQLNQSTAELYQLEVDDAFPYRLYAGQQDNTTISLPSHRDRSRAGGWTADWQMHGGCETGPIVPKPGDPDIVYANCKGRFGVYNRRTGQEQQYYVGFWNIYGHNPRDLRYRFQRVAPVHVSPHDPDRVYHGSQFVHVTEDRGRTWRTISPDLTAFTDETQVVSGSPITLDVTGEEHFSTLYEIQESPHEPGVIWVGANDGPVHITRDAGVHWLNITPQGLEPYGRVQQIDVSPHVPSKAYVCILRYQLGDFAPYVYRTNDYGATWTRIVSGIPEDTPVRVVREDPVREGLLYAGTETGMFVSFDDGLHWRSFQQNLPITPITDIQRVGNDLALSTMGRGFWILYDITPLHELGHGLVEAQNHLFAVNDAYRLHGDELSDTVDPAAPDYPPLGANIDYRLSSDAAAIQLTILDQRGQAVREFFSDQPSRSTMEDAEPEMHDGRADPAGEDAPELERTAGMHRFVWDLRHVGPWHHEPDKSERGGPLVPPGLYRALLRAGAWSASREFRVQMDPRVVAEGEVSIADIEEQSAFSLGVRDALSDARRAAAQIDKAREALAENEDLPYALESAYQALVTNSVRYSRPMLIDQLQYLYSNLVIADQAPGADARERFEQLGSALSRELDRVREAPATASPE
jgi:photosystem II stability/assembly factor-like uncharacterized protein